uniref:AlNc14C201G8684 protein n=1 Tax=Albugo laibachii Nc14 TaxID=890382 RepID=F0WQL7_9STRA|nr:AlNc14C201G8684 [Albugo laibachii Nc14]|eukprot:CCA23626.1 AlNc14C201G8684 [Albugo laibachii Nc14]
MKATSLLCILILRHFRYCAGRLASLIITSSSANYETCQYCLLISAGAIHVEEIEFFDKNKYKQTKYWVLGSPKYLAANLISCFGRRTCYYLEFKESNSPIVTEGIGWTSTEIFVYQRANASLYISRASK